MSNRVVICPNCRLPADCEAANYIHVTAKDAPTLSGLKHISLKATEGWSTWRPYYHAIHYPKISPSLENLKLLPPKYSHEKWSKGFGMPDSKDLNSVISCGACGHLAAHKLKWPEDAFFKIDYKGRILWARDRCMAMKILDYIESTRREKKTDYSYLVQDRDLRKIPTHFQSAKARSEISKKLRKVLELPAKVLA